MDNLPIGYALNRSGDPVELPNDQESEWILASKQKTLVVSLENQKDPLSGCNEVMNIMMKLHDEGRTIIMVTYNPEITENCDRVVRLRDGRILGEAS